MLENTITIDGNYITETELPPPSLLPWSEHINSKFITPGKQVTIAINTERVQNVFDGDDFKFRWQVTGMQVDEKLEGDSVNVTLPVSGAYVIRLFISQDNDPLAAEEINIQVGETPPASGITAQEGTETTNRLMLIDRIQKYTFKVINPDTNLYKYTWDLGDKDLIEATEAPKQFESTQLPNYVVLRTTDLATNTYSDSYVRIESKLEYENGVPMPPFRADNESRMNNSGIAVVISPVNLVLASLVGILILSVSSYLVIKYKERHTNRE